MMHNFIWCFTNFHEIDANSRKFYPENKIKGFIWKFSITKIWSHTVVANYVVLSVTLYFASIEKLSKFDGEYAGSQQLKIEKPHQAILASTLYIVVKHPFNNMQYIVTNTIY